MTKNVWNIVVLYHSSPPPPLSLLPKKGLFIISCDQTTSDRLYMKFTKLEK